VIPRPSSDETPQSLAIDLIGTAKKPASDPRSSGTLAVEGPRALTKNMSRWFARSRFADVKEALADAG
jgi:hypothetical protein